MCTIGTLTQMLAASRKKKKNKQCKSTRQNICIKTKKHDKFLKLSEAAKLYIEYNLQCS